MSAERPSVGEGSVAEKSRPAQRIDSVAWALFFIWVGVAMLAAAPWQWFDVGAGVLILAAQFARWRMDIKVEGFWIVCGAALLAGGFWKILDLPWPLAPILLILLGAAMLGKTFVGRGR